MLLEREREEKFTLLRGKEKLERDVNSYLQAMKEKDNKIAVLAARVKQVERDNFDSVARAKKETEEYKQQFHQMSRKCRLMQAKIDSSLKYSPLKLLDRGSPGPPSIPLEEIPERELQSSLSPTRELTFSSGIRHSQMRVSASQKAWLTPTAKKTRPEQVLRPQSAPKNGESRIPKLKLSSRN